MSLRTKGNLACETDKKEKKVDTDMHEAEKKLEEEK